MQNIRTDLAVEAHELSRREAKNATEIDGRNNKRKRK